MRRILFVVVILVALLPTMSSFAQGGELLVRSPMQGETVIGNTMTVFFETPGITIVPSPIKVEEAGKHPEANKPGEGHLHFMLDLQPLGVWGSSDPYTFENMPPGDHVLTIEIVQNDHASFTPPLVQQIRFTSVEAPAATPQEVASLPNTGVESVAGQSSTHLMVVLSGCLIVCGSYIRRRTR